MKARRIEVEEVGDVTIVRFVDKMILEESQVGAIGRQLFSLLEDQGKTKILIDFENIEYLGSAIFSKLIALDKTLKASGGKLRMCSIRQDIFEVFRITRLDKLFKCSPNKESALKCF